MAEDTRNFIDQAQARAELITGREFTPGELATEFAKLPKAERVDHLDRLNVDLAGSDLTIREASRLVEYAGALRNTHSILNKVNR